MKKSFLLLFALAALFVLPTSAEKRIYIVYGDGGNDPLPSDYTTVDYRRNWSTTDLWANGMGGPGHPVEGGFNGTGYQQYWSQVTGSKFAFMYIIKTIEPNPDNIFTSIDLREVTADWTYHIAVKPGSEAGKPLQFRFYGDEGVDYRVDLPGDFFPDGGGWNEATIEMADIIDLGLDFANHGNIPGTAGGNEFLRVVGDPNNVPTEESEFGIDDMYFTDNGTGEVAVEKVSGQKNIPALVTGNGLLKVINNPSKGFDIYSMSGSLILKSKTDIAEVSQIPTGIYIVKAGSKALKFVVE